jgi:hypothetical protein
MPLEWTGLRKVSCSGIQSLPATQGQRSKDVTCLTGASKAVLHGRSQEATVGGWLKSARQSGLSDGLRVSVI